MTTEEKFAEFIAAQNSIYDQVLRELTAGRKQSHWIWFIFPQLTGLGSSFMAQKFALTSKTEARQYLQHPILGPRLRECINLLLALPDQNIRTILGTPDDLKFRSCLTLFAQAAPDDPLFQTALSQYFGGTLDARTLELLPPHA